MGKEITALDPNGLANNGTKRQPYEVWVTQYLRPHAIPQVLRAPVGTEYVNKLERYEPVVLTCEVLMGGQLVMYGRFEADDPDDDASLELIEYAVNTPDPNHPRGAVQTLRKLIDDLLSKR